VERAHLSGSTLGSRRSPVRFRVGFDLRSVRSRRVKPPDGRSSSDDPNTIDHLTGEQLRRYRFPFPPFEQQERIAAFLDTETAKIDTIVTRVEDGIRRLGGYRAALMSAAVTGQIDVREAV
jgi:hypothetical protein